jgi:hypothetical protein
LVSRARLEVVLKKKKKWTHHLHEKPTRNTLDPHKSQQVHSQAIHFSSQHHYQHSQQRPNPEDLESIDMESMRDQIHEMEGGQGMEDRYQYGDDDLLMEAAHEGMSQMEGVGEDDADDVDITEMLHVIDAFSMPRWSWASDIKTFTRVESSTTNEQEPDAQRHSNGSSHANSSTNHVLGQADEKTAMFRARYHVLLQRIMRNECFAPPVFTGGMEQDRYLKLTPLKALKGRCGERFLMFGMLVQMGDGKYSLEDADDRVELVMDHSVRFRPSAVNVVYKLR